MCKRIRLLIWLITGLLFLVSGKLFYLQIIKGKDLAEKAVILHSRIFEAEEHYRGEILDHNLISLTDSGLRPCLMVFPEDCLVHCAELAELLGLVVQECEKQLKAKQEPFLLKINLSKEEVKKLREVNFPGTAIVLVKTRYGPHSLAKHLIGYLNSINTAQWEELTRNGKTIDMNNFWPGAYRRTDKIGVAGLEKEYEEILRGARPEKKLKGLTDARGQLLEGLGYKFKDEVVDSWRNHLILTIDHFCQECVEKIMDEKIEKGAVVVIDIPSGDLLALASRPDFDQNNIVQYLDEEEVFLERTRRRAFYPGSVFKTVVAAGVLEENLVEPAEKFVCTGSYLFSDQTEINCLSKHGSLDLRQALIKSCNSIFVQLGLRLGADKLMFYANNLGFEIDLGDSIPPALLGNASLGQEGVLVSPLQIANLYATIARGGLYKPCRLVAEIRNYQGDLIQDFPTALPRRVLKTSTCQILKEALSEVCRSGTGQLAWVGEEGTAGKTGTAQVNEQGKVIAWFAGFTPVEEPRLAIVVMVEEKKAVQGSLRGGEVAAPIFRDIAAAICQ